ncbi:MULTISPECIES: maleylpyruvate isomerase family mycothiol-dependent enzyme [Paenarthrobacter]|uniref:maleylpyruvate isomerase family mycothiol-dependent enzyme n=1 Tax=Paenarthrobacter TaxID=1742992 RepID=UPI00074D3712|nr:maleylpyruvate isomerase family mycothiol-dependent enzyme [Paenarthrobacter ureafaciens]AMB39041.1 maleylpyruvate isomerase [Arthrobacter sp. ATCC 21022]KUR64057.1 maleylpyruvate isomerase [Arthrobacter sp. ATCC 21022]MBN9130230.1 maleylpyruvate isomerase family mycothiol-dependent enzyme [Paenarthrobacter ureafaciens]RWW95251.1 maleylpyruvate isomerase family mycothiol-dependent enzyme [Paenarthrobacter ureafaciens]UOD81609.1 maleylpyruvate isomerase family mycothiol-dependent enzyme [Pae
MVARHDLTTDPRLQEDLLQARRGTAFFARKLNELTDEELDGGTRLPGWTRRHLVAHVGYNARAIARLIEWAGTGVETPMYSSPEARGEEIQFGATLSPIALRNLFGHSAVHLSVEWRDLPDADWSNEVRTAQGRTVPASETAWMRTREVWMHAVDLDNGATFNDIPAPVLERLLKDITSAWRTRETDTGLLIKVTGTAENGTDLTFGDTSAADPTFVSGPLAAVVEWAAGRGNSGVTAAGPDARAGEVPAAPMWI